MTKRAQVVRQESAATTDVEYLCRRAAGCTSEFSRDPWIAQPRLRTQERDRIIVRAVPALAQRFINGVVHARQLCGVVGHSASLTRTGSVPVGVTGCKFQYSD